MRVEHVAASRQSSLRSRSRSSSSRSRGSWPQRGSSNMCASDRVQEPDAGVSCPEREDEMSPKNQPVVHGDPEIMSGTPVFVGTRVPFQTLLDYVKTGQPLSEFLQDFPTVSKEQALAALGQHQTDTRDE